MVVALSLQLHIIALITPQYKVCGWEWADGPDFCMEFIVLRQADFVDLSFCWNRKENFQIHQRFVRICSSKNNKKIRVKHKMHLFTFTGMGKYGGGMDGFTMKCKQKHTERSVLSRIQVEVKEDNVSKVIYNRFSMIQGYSLASKRKWWRRRRLTERWRGLAAV